MGVSREPIDVGFQGPVVFAKPIKIFFKIAVVGAKALELGLYCVDELDLSAQSGHLILRFAKSFCEFKDLFFRAMEILFTRSKTLVLLLQRLHFLSQLITLMLGRFQGRSGVCEGAFRARYFLQCLLLTFVRGGDFLLQILDAC